MYVYGRNVLREILALPDGRVKVKKLFFTDQENVDRDLKRLQEESRRRGWKVETTRPERLFDLCREKKNQGVVVDIKDFPYAELEDILSSIDSKPSSTLVVLDQVQDPHNLGAIIRTAAAAGGDGIIIGVHSSAEVTPAVAKVSSGLVFRLAVARVVNIASTLEKLKKRGYWTYASATGGENLWEIEFAPRSVLVFGNENEGVRRLVRERADHLVSIPMEAGVDSLNVAAAAAVFLYERRRKAAAG